MAITASQVNELRKITGAGMMDCKNALSESNGDIKAAIDLLRKKGQKISEKRADRETTEGVIIAKTNNNASTGVLVELSCETDFVAKNEDFTAFAEKIASHALNNSINDINTLKEESIDGQKVSEKISELVGKIGEKIELSNFVSLSGTAVVPYIHAGNKIGVLVALTKNANDEIKAAGRDVAMQIAAMKPIGLDKDDIDPEVIEREKQIAVEQIKNEGKPAELADKIAQGKLNKFFKENTLLSQPFVKDGSKTVLQRLQDVDKELTVSSYKRLEIASS
jgi:elongation factor Ts